MQARCPHCSSVFSTERSGIQYCPNCGQQINVPQAPGETGPSPAPSPAPAVLGPPSTEPVPAREDTPWERRATLGIAQGLWATWKDSVFSPGNFWQRVRPDAPWTEALTYGWVISLLAQLFAVPMNLLGTGLQRGQVEQVLRETQQMPLWVRHLLEAFAGGAGTHWLIGSALVGVMLYPLVLIISSAIIHLFCMLFGASKNGYWATVRVMAYASGPLVLQGIPCLGPLAALYVMVLQVWGITQVQETTTGRAIGAVLTPIGVACCCACGLALSIGAAIAAHAAG